MFMLCSRLIFVYLVSNLSAFSVYIVYIINQCSRKYFGPSSTGSYVFKKIYQQEFFCMTIGIYTFEVKVI